MENNQRNSRKRLNSLILLVAFTAVMLIVSTYAWFSAQKNVTLSNLTGIVKVAEGLEVSLDANKWSQEINFANYDEDDATTTKPSLTQLYGTTPHNIVPTELLPASTDGITATTDTTLGLYVGTNTEVDAKSKLTDIVATDQTLGADAATASDADYPGYYAIDVFLRNSSRTTGEDILQLNANSSLQLLSATKETSGLQNTVRVGFALYNSKETVDQDSNVVSSVQIDATQEQILKATTSVDGQSISNTQTIKHVAIWEPHANTHVDEIVNSNNRITWLTTDAEAYLADEEAPYLFTATEKIPTYALKAAAVNATIADIYDWSGTNSATLAKQITLQTTRYTDDNGAYVADNYETEEGVQNLITTAAANETYVTTGTGTPTYFTIPKAQVCRLRMYVWLEGQDVDCTNFASHGGGINLEVGLVKDAKIGGRGEAADATATPTTTPTGS